jgi:hypothetical protein
VVGPKILNVCVTDKGLTDKGFLSFAPEKAGGREDELGGRESEETVQ